MDRTTIRRTGNDWYWERASFSFQALYEIAHSAAKVEAEPPFDPYDLRAWPPRRLNARLFEARYQFHTRNLEMAALIVELSRALPSLKFVLATLCLDDGSIESYRLWRGAQRRWNMPERRQEAHWDRARRRLGLKADLVYEDDQATMMAEDGMLAEALDHWDSKRGNRMQRCDWWNAPKQRDFETEREIALTALRNELPAPPKKPKGTGQGRGRTP
jgi:hypothetical protein